MLAHGYLADLVVIDRDLVRADPTSLADARVTTTIVGGRVVHEAR
jgi:predicted amidohydrolase YtcJ